MPDPDRPDVTVRRTYQVYLYAVCFVSVLVVLFGTGAAVYGLFKIVFPGVISDLEHSAIRKEGARAVIQSGIFALLALGIFLFHWQYAREVRAELEAATPPPPEPQYYEPIPSEPLAAEPAQPARRRRTPPPTVP